MRETVSHHKPKKLPFAKECVMNVLAPPSPTPLTESQQISSNRAKNDVCVLIRLEMDQKGHKGAEIYEKRGF